FVNRTERPDLEQRVTARVISEFVTRSKYRILSSEEGVDAVLRGEILTYVLNPVSIDEQGRANRYEIILNPPAALGKTADDRTLWQADHFVFRRQYDLTPTSVGVVSQEQTAIDLMAGDFAEAVVTSILEGF